MQGINIDPEILSQVQGNLLAQNAIHIAQLEAAVQQLALENQELREMIPAEEEVKADASSD